MPSMRSKLHSYNLFKCVIALANYLHMMTVHLFPLHLIRVAVSRSIRDRIPVGWDDPAMASSLAGAGGPCEVY